MLSAVSIAKEKRNFTPPHAHLQVLQNRLVQFSLFNLLLVALLGLLLRAYPFLEGVSLNYKNVLHGHSHFAFGGWVMPILLALQLRFFPRLSQQISYRHWRNIAVLLLASAYGMLVSFPLQGYKPISIIFSTLSVGAGYYWAIVVRQALHGRSKNTSERFLQWGLIYLSLSAIGPFATGPLIVMGYQGSPLYYNAVYFYLHFQYNGWFTFAVLAVFYQLMAQKDAGVNGIKVFLLLNAACIPTFCLSVLWNGPGSLYNLVGGFGAMLQLGAFVLLMRDVKVYQQKEPLPVLLKLAMAAFFLKLLLQLLNAVPVIASMAYQFRNFVIAYLHLVLLGFISVFAFAMILKWYNINWGKRLTIGAMLFFFAFCSTESLLVLQAVAGMTGFVIPNYSTVLLVCSIGFPLGVLFLFSAIRKGINIQLWLYRQGEELPVNATVHQMETRRANMSCKSFI